VVSVARTYPNTDSPHPFHRLESVIVPSWIVDDPTLVGVLLGLLAFGLAVGWWRSRRVGYAIAGVVVLAILGIVWFLHVYVDTDAKQIDRTIAAIGAGVQAHNVDQIFGHIAADFQVAGMDRQGFRNFVSRFLSAHVIQGVQFWDYDPVQLSRQNRRATVTFKVRAWGLEEERGVAFYNCRAIFVLEPDGKWRLQTFLLFMPQIDPMHGEPIPLPM
jgi:hypothetical protein